MQLLYQEAEVVYPDPGIPPVDAASPGRLVHLLHCSDCDVWHRRVGQRKGDTDPLKPHRNKSNILFVFKHVWQVYNKMGSYACFLVQIIK